jgi:hypothetical protein
VPEVRVKRVPIALCILPLNTCPWQPEIFPLSEGKYFLGGAFSFYYRPSSAAPPPQKNTQACLSQAPTKRGVCASLPAALLPVNATHVAAVPCSESPSQKYISPR